MSNRARYYEWKDYPLHYGDAPISRTLWDKYNPNIMTANGRYKRFGPSARKAREFVKKYGKIM